MSVGNGKDPAVSRVPEQVHRHTEATLKLVMAAGDVARAMWRLLVAERSRHQMEEPERVARRVIDTFRRRQGATLDVYVLAAYAAALANAGSSDAAALALINVASVHEHLGYAEDARRLIEVADTDDVSDRVRRALATARACTVQQQPYQPDSSAHHAEQRPEGRDR